MKLKLIKDYIRLVIFMPSNLLRGIEKSVHYIKKKSGLSSKGWDDDWSFYVFLAIFAAFISISIYY